MRVADNAEIYLVASVKETLLLYIHQNLFFLYFLSTNLDTISQHMKYVCIVCLNSVSGMRMKVL